jgi:uncharacterized membrane protein (UPF0127 family)
MAWLLRGGEVLAGLTVASSRADRRRGLLGRDGIDGALLIERARSVHTVGMRFPIDVAFCDEDLVVVRTRTLAPGRVTLPVRRARHAVEAEAGTFAAWNLVAGDALEVAA